MTGDRNTLQGLLARFERLTKRERVMVLVALLAVLIFLWDAALMAPLRSRQRDLSGQVGSLEAQIAQLQVEAETVQAQGRLDPDAANRQRFEQLGAEVAQMEEALRRQLIDVISPQAMLTLLRQLVDQQKTLSLVRLAHLDTEVLRPPEAPAETLPADEQTVLPQLFKHRMVVELEGSYLELLSYLQAVEQLPRRIFWNDCRIELLRYPKARARVQVYTLSTQRRWLGV